MPTAPLAAPDTAHPNPPPGRAAFWYPSRVIGGAEALLIRLISGLSSHGVECDLWDYPDGHTVAILRKHNIPFRLVPCDNEGFPPAHALSELRSTDILTVFHTHLFRLPVETDVTCKFLLWEVHNAFWIPDKSRTKETLKRHICSTLLSRGGLATIEPGSYAAMQAAGVSGPAPHRIPISIDLPPAIRAPRQDAPAMFAGLGRASRDKVIGPAWAFAKITLQNPAARFAYLCDDPVRAQALFKKIAPALAEKVEFPHDCVGTAAQSWLVNHADVVLSMGTSALDAGKHGIPTVIVDGCEHRKYPTAARVRLLWENEGFNTVYANPSTNAGRTIEEALDIIASDPAKAAAMSAAYVANHHAGDATSRAFLRAWADNAMPLDEILRDQSYARFAARELTRLRRQGIRRAWKRRLRNFFRL